MSRSCTTCNHLKRPDIDRRLAAGEPAAQVAREYDLNPSSVHRHRVNCLGLASANAIKKEAARGTAAMALLPSKEELGSAYRGLTMQIDEIVAFLRTLTGAYRGVPVRAPDMPDAEAAAP